MWARTDYLEFVERTLNKIPYILLRAGSKYNHLPELFRLCP